MQPFSTSVSSSRWCSHRVTWGLNDVRTHVRGAWETQLGSLSDSRFRLRVMISGLWDREPRGGLHPGHRVCLRFSVSLSLPLCPSLACTCAHSLSPSLTFKKKMFVKELSDLKALCYGLLSSMAFFLIHSIELALGLHLFSVNLDDSIKFGMCI